MKAALYARVSLDEHEDDRRYQDPENQLIPLREWAKTQGFEVYNEYVDKASGADAGRPGFRALIKDSMFRYFGIILVWKLDRFSRENMSNVVSYITQLKNRGIALMSLTENWVDTRKENPTSELVIAFMSWAAAEERRKISERTKAGIRRLRAIGAWKGGRPRKGGVPCPSQNLSVVKGTFSTIGNSEVV